MLAPKLALAFALLCSLNQAAHADIGWWQHLECKPIVSYDSSGDVTLESVTGHVGHVMSFDKWVELSISQNIPLENNERIGATLKVFLSASKPKEDYEQVEKALSDETDFTVEVKTEKALKRTQDGKTYPGYGLGTTISEASVEVTFLSSPKISALEAKTGAKLSGTKLKRRMKCIATSKSV